MPPPRRVFSGLDCRVTDFHCALPTCARRGEALPEGSDMCSGCRTAVYCSKACLQAHYPRHKEACYKAIRVRVHAGDVHKDDGGGEYVLKDLLDECKGAHGALDERTLECMDTLGRYYQQLGSWGRQRRCCGSAWRGGAPHWAPSTLARLSA